MLESRYELEGNEMRSIVQKDRCAYNEVVSSKEATVNVAIKG
jgi:hypothetical protein